MSLKIGDFDLFIHFSLLLHNLFGAKGWEVFLNDQGLYPALHMVFLFSGLGSLHEGSFGTNLSGVGDRV